MTPYYDEDGITIYHADCADVLPDIHPDRVDLVLTDPPYGIGLTFGGMQLAPTTDTEQVLDDNRPFDPRPLLTFGRCVLFGANHYADKLPPSAGWIVWDKWLSDSTYLLSECEMAWTNVSTRVRAFRHRWSGWLRDSEQGAKRVHPTQKPVALMRWILEEWTYPGQLVLDPYMGSGPVAQACHEMGRRYIGVEIVERYCEIAVQRLAQGVLTFDALAGGEQP